MKTFRSVVITGASSGIGKALALGYAQRGLHLSLTGRDVSRLERVTAACSAAGATVDTRAIDVMNREAMASWLHNVDAAHPVDLVIVNAGVSLAQGAAENIDETLTRQTFAINMEGAFNTVFPLLPAMRARRAGQIALMASLAGFIGLPTAAAYNGSKAALRVWGESLRHALRPDGIGVSVVCPGFVATPMNSHSEAPRPFLMSAERASLIIRKGLARDRARIAFPFPSKAAVWFANALPGSLAYLVVRRRGAQLKKR